MTNLKTILKHYAKRIIEETIQNGYEYDFNEGFFEQGNFEQYSSQFYEDCKNAKGYMQVEKLFKEDQKQYECYREYDNINEILCHMLQKEIDKLEKE